MRSARTPRLENIKGVPQLVIGNGIAAASLSILTGYVFETTNLVRLQASIFSPNKASMSVARKAGYQCEAILRQAIYKNGEFYDEHLYVKLKS